MKSLLRAVCFGFAAVILAGCGEGAPKVESIPVKNPDVLNEVYSTLRNYERGKEITSEATTFDDLIRRLDGVDPKKARILERGLEAMKKLKQPALKAKARELIEKLGLE